jgi:hypothetical protein
MSRALLVMALDALDTCESLTAYYHDEPAVEAAITAITAALAQPEPEPLGYASPDSISKLFDPAYDGVNLTIDKSRTDFATMAIYSVPDQSFESTKGQTIDGIFWPNGYCTDPNGKIIAPKGRHEDFNFGYERGYADGLLAIRTSIQEIERRALTKYLRGEKE